MLVNLLLGWITLLLVTIGSTIHGVDACNRYQKDVGVCLHIYLERDFSDIESIVFPKQREDATHHRTLLMDGPELENNCNRIHDMFACLADVLPECSYGDFFAFRHLLHSLNRTHVWVCADMRQRFLVLLRSVACIEEERNGRCNHPNISPNVWQKLLRLEVGDELCGQLWYQRNCLLEDGALDRCGSNVSDVYGNMSHVFLNTWCPQYNTFSRSSLAKSSTAVYIIITLILFLELFC